MNSSKKTASDLTESIIVRKNNKHETNINRSNLIDNQRNKKSESQTLGVHASHAS
jgi:hypothetical protein